MLIQSNHILKDKDFLIYWISHIISTIGNTIVPLTITFAVLEITGSATSLGVVLGALWISRVIFITFGGVWADRLSRKKVILFSDILQGSNHLIIALLFFSNQIELWHLVVSALFYGSVSAFHAPATSGLIPQIVKGESLQQANSLLSIVNSLFQIAGPAIAGALVLFVGFGNIFLLDALTFFSSFILVLFIRPNFKAESTPKSTYWEDLKEGIDIARQYTWIWSSMVAFSILNFAVASFSVLGPLVVTEKLNGPTEWGLILTSGSIGGLIGGVLSHKLKPKSPLKFSFTLMTIFVSLQIASLINPISHWIIMVFSLLASASMIIGGVFWDTLVQREVPEHLLSRIGSLDSFVSFVFMPVGFVLAGPLSEKLGMNWTLALISSLVFITNIWVIYFRDYIQTRKSNPYSSNKSRFGS
ncbi:MFS transporter [Pontibacillus salipaludis]|uniref:MFS transporter n=1 Tax=Pontibacillus salipaludis TaxID=1697394 RepID=A0ABQ1QJU7_9BACI|nr:MFS transporter [Pontibacillus salipaludis]GGD29565.1 MFS transporter [Pontibacillus salipaludis]